MNPDEFKQAMGRFPAGVTIVTTRDAEGIPWGFTASSFASLSLDPPLVLVCLADAAESAPAFSACERMTVSILGGNHEPIALRFARKNLDKFADSGWRNGADGVPFIEGARAVLSGPIDARHPGGDHTILVMRVDSVTLGETPTTLTYSARTFHALP